MNSILNNAAFWVKRYNASDDTTTLAVSSDQGSAFKLQDEIVKTSQELSRIYASLVRMANFSQYLLTSILDNLANSSFVCRLTEWL